MKRGLSDFAVRHQAEAFASYFSRLGAGEKWEAAFARWAPSKDFSRADSAAIRAARLPAQEARPA